MALRAEAAPAGVTLPCCKSDPLQEKGHCMDEACEGLIQAAAWGRISHQKSAVTGGRGARLDTFPAERTFESS